MPTLRQNLAFTGGELAPALHARVDQEKYQSGLATMRNFICQKTGGAASRPGTTFIGEIASSAATARLVNWSFNADQSYLLIFTNLKLQFVRNAAFISDLTLTITGITQANPGVVTYTGTDPANGDIVYIADVVGMTQVNGRSYKVANVNGGANTFELTEHTEGTNINTTSFTAYSSAGTADRRYTVTTPYVTADLAALNIVQSGDVMTIAHPNYQPRELSRTGHTTWTLATISTIPGITPPTLANAATTGGGTGFDWKYVVTAVNSETLEESTQSNTATVTNEGVPTTADPNVVQWTAPVGFTVQEYNVYRQKQVVTGNTSDGLFGFVGTARGLLFNDDGTVDPDFSDSPPIARTLFASTDNYPAAVTYFQQRLAFGGTNNDPETIWLSKAGQFKNFTIRSPIADDDAITFTLAGRQVNKIRHLLDMDKLVAYTTGAEWVVFGNESGIILPTAINARQQTYNGCSILRPLTIYGHALYVQSKVNTNGSVVRSFGFTLERDGYRGDDLTIFSSHLFQSYTLSDWDYQQDPDAIVWTVRSDGKLLGATYVPEHELLAWHRHDTAGTFENVVTVPEGDDQAVYFVVKRTINGLTKRYVERLAQRRVDDIVDFVGSDAVLTYDGRNVGATTMTLSGGTSWDYSETLTLTASAGFFEAGDVGNYVHLRSGTSLVRFRIDTYSSATVVTGKILDGTVPAALQATATTDWGLAVDDIAGLWHLEGKDVSVLGDGYVVSSPGNPNYSAAIETVATGAITLSEPREVIQVGLPFVADLLTLDIDEPGPNTLADRKKLVTKLTLHFEESRGGWVAPEDPEVDTIDTDLWTEMKQDGEESPAGPPALETGTDDILIAGRWSRGGRVMIRQVDPLPLTVLAIHPTLSVGEES